MVVFLFNKVATYFVIKYLRLSAPQQHTNNNDRPRTETSSVTWLEFKMAADLSDGKSVQFASQKKDTIVWFQSS